MGKNRFLSWCPVLTTDENHMRSVTPELYRRCRLNLTNTETCSTTKLRSKSLPTSLIHRSNSFESLPAPILKFPSFTIANDYASVRSFYRITDAETLRLNTIRCLQSSCATTAIPNEHFNVSVVGTENTGKSGLVHHFVHNDISTYADYDDDDSNEVSVVLNERRTSLVFTESVDVTDGSKDILTSDVLTPDGYVIAYSVTDRNSFNHAVNVLSALRSMKLSENRTVILVANKCDIVRQRKVTHAESVSIADQYSCKHVEVSVLLGHRINELLIGLVVQLRRDELSRSGEKDSQKSVSDSRGSVKKWFLNIARHKFLV